MRLQLTSKAAACISASAPTSITLQFELLLSELRLIKRAVIRRRWRSRIEQETKAKPVIGAGYQLTSSQQISGI